MSSRALRKAQREREEQDRLRQLEQEARDLDDDGDADDDVPTPPARQSVFAMLGEDNQDEDDDNDEGVTVNDHDEERNLQPPKEVLQAKSTIQKAPGSKKSKKKAAKSKPALATDGDDLDEIDRALKELSTQNAPVSASKSAGLNSSTDEMCKVLAIETDHLHSQNEMRRLFGRAALEQQDDEQPGPPANIGGNRRQQRRVQQLGLAEALRRQGGQGGRSAGLAALALRRNIFVQGKEEWPQAPSGGLGMEVEEKRADGTTLYRFAHNRVYQDVQAQFQIAVESMDPNRLVVLLQHNPYHISTLLQVSEIAKQDRDHATSGDLLSRALFSFGRAVHSTFPKQLSEGKARLDFRRPENREFWLAVWRHMQNLSMRALWRTVYEWAKLLLSLAPEEDPYAMWLVLDQYALRARQDLDLLNISRSAVFEASAKTWPNVQLSQGLADYRAGNKSKGQQALFRGMGRYPWMVAKLMQELALDAPPAIWGKAPRTEKEVLNAELYATRAKDVWNTPENTALMQEIASAILPETPSADPDNSEIEENVARHVLLSDTPALIALIPKRYTSALMSSSDPLPPKDSYPSYLPKNLSRGSAAGANGRGAEEGTAVDNLRELHGLYGFFSNLFPWFNREGGENGNGNPEMTEDEIVRRIGESGVDEDLVVQRTRRTMELQDRLRGDFGEDGLDPAAANPLVATETLDGEGEHAVENHQPRIEDAEDAGD